MWYCGIGESKSEHDGLKKMRRGFCGDGMERFILFLGY